MNKLDWLDLDAKLLRLLVTVIDTGSVTQASHQLGVTQSAVSHLLDKLRAITGDPLFVKSGRGIAATAQAEALAVRARSLLGDLERFAHAESFDPAKWRTQLTIAANDFQRELLLPALMKKLRSQSPGVTLRVIPSDIPSLEMLRQEHCQLAISPRPPEATDVMQKRLFVDRYRVFFDGQVRKAPSKKSDYLLALHATVMYSPKRALDLDQHMIDQGIHRQFQVMVPGFAALPGFLRGTDMLVTAPSMLSGSLMQEFASTEVPVPCPSLPMYMVWHLRYQNDPAHQWLRKQIESLTRKSTQ
jgi:DNA-binding transcriptional LysR family regulator